MEETLNIVCYIMIIPGGI